jgi:O-antigen/teichoic acid export membrane protein
MMFLQLGADVFGLFVVVGTLMGFGGLLTFGAGDATLRLVAKYRALKEDDKLGRVIQCSSLVFVVAGISAAIILKLGTGFLISLFDAKENGEVAVSTVIPLAGVGLIFLLPASGLKAVVDGFERLDLTGWVNTIFAAIEVSAQLLLLYLGHGLLSFIWLMVVVRAMMCLTLIVLASRLLKGRYKITPSWDYPIFKEAINFGIYLWMGSVFNRIWNSGLPIIVGAILGLPAVGVFALAMKPISALVMIIDKTTSFLFPYLTGVFEKKQKDLLFLRYEQITYVAVTTGASFCGVVVFLGAPLVGFWLKDEAPDSIVVLIQILAIRFAVHPASMVASQFMRASEKSKALLLIQIVSSMTLTLSTVIGAYLGGLVGVALAQFAVFGLVMFNRCLVEKQLFEKFRLGMQLKVILSATVPPALMWIFAISSDTLTVWQLAAGLLAFGVCACLPLLFLRAQASLLREGNPAT